MNTAHTSKQFDLELNDVRSSIIQMGQIAIRQFELAMKCLEDGDAAAIALVLDMGPQVDRLEVEIDRKCNLVLAQRQPEANDLRRILTVLKITGEIERAGAQAELIIRRAETLLQQDRLPNSIGLGRCANHALEMACAAIDAFANSDAHLAAHVVKMDVQVNEEYGNITRKLIGKMLEDPVAITSALDILFVAKAIERIADHAKNIAQYVIFMVKGFDVRHASIEEMENSATCR